VWARPAIPVLCLAGLVALLCTPYDGEASEREVKAAVLELAGATAGTFGDEGARILPAVDALERAVGRWDATLEALAESARRSGARDGQTHLALSAAYLHRGRAAEALVAAETALAAAPQDPAVHRQRGLALEALGRTVESVGAFERAWTLGSQDGGTAFLAFRAADDAARATRAFSVAHEQCLAAPAPLIHASFDLLDATISDTPLLPPSIYARGYAHLARKAFGDAVAEFRRAATADPLLADPAASLPELAAGTAALRRGELAEARRQLDSARIEAPASSELYRILGLVSLVGGDRSTGLEHLKNAIRLNPSNERARIAMARIHVDAGRTADAEQVLLDTLRVLPESRLAHWWLGWVYEQLNQLAEARAHLARSAGPETLAGRHRVLSAVARLSRVHGDFVSVVPALERAVRAAPNDVLTRKELAFAYLEQDRPLEAFRELVAACAVAPADPDVHALVGRIHLDADRPDAAVPALRRALELAPGHADARYALATALLRLGDDEAAAREREVFDRASRASIEARRRQMAVDVLSGEAAVRTAEGFHDRAVALWERVVEVEPERVAHLRNLAAAQVRAGRTLEAIQTYERSASVEGGAEVYRRLAELYAQVGRHDDSRRASLMSDSARQAEERGGGR
jgi:tetratricopeptide (TPR) repeat protein